MVLIFLPAFLVQSWKIPIVYAWYYVNKTEITDRFCINKARPELLCSGKCYVQKVIVEYESSTEDWKSLATKSIDKRTITLIKNNHSIDLSSLDESTIKAPTFRYLFNYSHTIDMMVFRPPRVLA